MSGYDYSQEDSNEMLEAADKRIAALAAKVAALEAALKDARYPLRYTVTLDGPDDVDKFFDEVTDRIDDLLPGNDITQRATSETPGEYKPEAVARILAARDAPAERSFPNGEGLMEWLHDGKLETPAEPEKCQHGILWRGPVCMDCVNEAFGHQSKTGSDAS